MKENRKLVVVVGVLLVSGLVFAAIVAAFFVSKAGPALLDSIANISTSKSGNRGEGEFKFDSDKIIEIEQKAGDVESLVVNVAIKKGEVIVKENELGDVLRGTVGYLGGKPNIESRRSGSAVLTLEIKSEDGAGENVSLDLVPKVRSVVNLGVGIGNVRVDLSKLDVSLINVAVGTGNTEVTFSGTNSTTASLATGVGNVKLRIPKGAEHKIVYKQAAEKNDIFSDSDYVVEGNSIKTRGYDSAKIRIVVNVGVGVGKTSFEFID